MTQRTFSLLRFAPCLILAAMLLLPEMGWAASMPKTATETTAKTLGDMTNYVYDSFIPLQIFLSVLSYLLGIFFSITGLKMLRDHVDDPGRNPLQASLLRMGAAAFFLFSPSAVNILTNTITGNASRDFGAVILDTSNVETKLKLDGAGLEMAVARFVVDIASPLLDNAIPVFAYAAGIILMLIGLKRMALANGDGPQAPGGLGTMGTFLVAAGLMSFGFIMFTLQGSIFGTNTIYDFETFNIAEGTSNTVTDRANQTLWAVFVFLRIVGYISVLRGLFMLRAVAEGGNVSMMAVMTHMIAGAMLANGGMMLEVIQCSFIRDTSQFAISTIGKCK